MTGHWSAKEIERIRPKFCGDEFVLPDNYLQAREMWVWCMHGIDTLKRLIDGRVGKNKAFGKTRWRCLFLQERFLQANELVDLMQEFDALGTGGARTEHQKKNPVWRPKPIEDRYKWEDAENV